MLPPVPQRWTKLHVQTKTLYTGLAGFLGFLCTQLAGNHEHLLATVTRETISGVTKINIIKIYLFIEIMNKKIPVLIIVKSFIHVCVLCVF